LHELDDAKFIAQLQTRYGGIPPEVLREPDLLALMIGPIRADMTALERYAHRDEPPLPLPIRAWGGERDANVSRDALGAWAPYTTSTFTMDFVPAGHHFLTSHLDTIDTAITTHLSKLGAHG
jgi:surfactin synthase thioesterase subunit